MRQLVSMVFPLTFSRIGLVVVSDGAGSEMEDHLTEVLTDHILGNATGTKTSPLLSQEDFREVSRGHTAPPVPVHTSPFLFPTVPLGLLRSVRLPCSGCTAASEGILPRQQESESLQPLQHRHASLST